MSIMQTLGDRIAQEPAMRRIELAIQSARGVVRQEAQTNKITRYLSHNLSNGATLASAQLSTQMRAVGVQ